MPNIPLPGQPLNLSSLVHLLNFTLSTSHDSLDISAIASSRPEHLIRTLSNISRLLRYAKIRSVFPIKTHGISEVAAALQALQTDGSHGKVIIEPKDDELILAPRVERVDEPLTSDATYVLIGGTGGLGRSMATWMIGKGAKNIVLLSRSGALAHDLCPIRRIER